MEETLVAFNKNDKEIKFSTRLKDDYIVKTITESNDFYESSLLDWIASLKLPKGDFVDVGANIGNHTIYFSKVLGRKTWAFEPYKKAYRELLRNISLNNLEQNVVPNNLALGSSNGKVDIEIEQEKNLGATKVIESKDGLIDLKTLDSVIPADKRVALIKIDVEGFELEVIEGAEKTIRRSRPLLLVECETSAIYQETVSRLINLGYVPINVFGATPMVVFIHSTATTKIDHSSKGAVDNLIQSKLQINELNLKLRKMNTIRERSHLLTNELALEKKNAEISRVAARKEITAIKNSKTFRIGDKIVSTLKGVYVRPLIGYPMRLTLKILDRKTSRNIIAEQMRLSNIELDLGPEPEKFIAPSEKAIKTHKVRIATIMDEFTYSSFRFECDLKQLTPENWKNELEEFKPEMLFIESAWRGVDDKWWNTVPKNCEELVEIMHYCRTNKIPTVFWNKEDPPHTATFLRTASMFDYVFTTDLDSVYTYKKLFKHDRVYLLPFAAQPKISNPIEKYERKDKFSFAGAYYDRYKERMRNLKSLSLALADYKGLEIWDRNFKKDVLPEQKFPDEYTKYIVGGLPFSKIDKAYKGYKYALNLTSIKQSPTMFARRVFELLASNTVTVSNYSRGVRLMFGDLVISTDNGENAVSTTKKLSGNENSYNKLRLAGLRKVMQEHTYEHRLNYVYSKVFNDIEMEDMNNAPEILGVSEITTKDNLNNVINNYSRQEYEHKRLLVITSLPKKYLKKIKGVRYVDIAYSKKNTFKQAVKESDYVWYISPEDYYGPKFLTDLSLATKYADHNVIGKAAHYGFQKNNLNLFNPGVQYKEDEDILREACIIKKQYLNEVNISDFINAEPKIYNQNTLSTDEFNYCKDKPKPNTSTEVEVNGEIQIDKGLELAELEKRAEEIKPRIKSNIMLRMLRINNKTKVDLDSQSSLVASARHLVLTNIYPSYDDLYRNGFVHARVLAYEKEGLGVDVYKFSRDKKLSFEEFENIDVISGSELHLDKLLKNNSYKSVLVHFLDEKMWSVLKNYINNTKIIVWVHGSEIQNWKRREYNYSTDEEKQEAISASNRRDAFWRSILEKPHQNLKLIFVSQYFADEVMEDLNIKIPKANYEIIHNYINTELFEFRQKPVSQRKKILSIRPFASNKYANDLSVKAVLDLSRRKYFNELEFNFIGDGELFDKTLAPIKHFKNVKISRGFLQQRDIAELHKQYGLFLVPTRMDAQGVSRDEAMSSGLVPLTNNVAAIPEFVDSSSGILAKADDSKGLSEGIDTLYKNPKMFARMSKAAAERVRKQSSYNQTIEREIKLIKSGE